MVTLTKPPTGDEPFAEFLPQWRLDETAPLEFTYLNDRNVPLVWRERRYGNVTVELRGRQ